MSPCPAPLSADVVWMETLPSSGTEACIHTQPADYHDVKVSHTHTGEISSHIAAKNRSQVYNFVLLTIVLFILCHQILSQYRVFQTVKTEAVGDELLDIPCFFSVSGR